MINMKSKSSHLLKLLALVPIVGTALALNARTITDYVYDEPQKQQPVKKGQKAGTISVNNQKIQVVTSKTTEHKDTITVNSPAVNTDGDKVFDVVDEMPQYPGGTSELMKFLAANIRYPKEAEEKGEQGRVIVSFIVDKDGSINGAYAINSTSPQLETEALRIVNSMPAWTPGKQNGEPVRVKFTMPIMFRLNDSNTPTTLINEVKQEGKKVTSVNYMRSINGETVEELTVKDDFDIMIDGVKTDKPMSEVLKELNPTDIESMKVDKSDPEKPVIKIITKKKK